MARSNSRDNNFILRAVTSVFITVIVLGALYLGGRAWHALVSVVAILSLFEFYSIIRTQFKIPVLLGLLGALLLVLSPDFLAGTPVGFSVILCCVAFLVLLFELLRREMTGNSFAFLNAGAIILGLVYIVLPWMLIYLLRESEGGFVPALALFLCTWSCDVGAYLFGSSLGVRKLCPNISPKKTWEGAFGGFLLSVICGVAIGLIVGGPLALFLMIGAICGFAGQVGDLVESVIKREFEVKDSGVLLPGHGGFLDRFDSILFNGVLVYMIWEIFPK